MEPVVSLQKLMELEFPEQEWMVDRLIPASSITLMSGAPSSFKTWALLDMALKVAQGEPLFGQFNTSPCGVLIIDEENGDRLLQLRLNKLRADKRLPIYFHSLTRFVLTDDTVDYVLEVCGNLDIKLLVIDSLVRIHTSDENKSGDMSEVFKQLKRFTTNGIAVLITHHNRKPGAGSSYGVSNEMRGSSDILAAADSHVALVRKDKKITFYQTKQRYAEELDPFEVVVVTDDDRFGFEYVGSLGKQDKAAKLREDILKLLSEHDKLFQKELLQHLEKIGAKTNEHKLREVLNSMLGNDDIDDEPGPGNTKFYRLPKGVPDEQS